MLSCNSMTIHETLILLKKSIYTVSAELQTEVWVTEEPVPFNKRYSGKHMVLSVGDKWGSLFDCGWFHFNGQIPIIKTLNKPVLLIDVNGELLVVDKEGNAIRGLTNGSSTFDRALGEPVKRVFHLPGTIQPDDTFDYWADAGCNDLFGELKEGGKLKQADIAFCNESVRSLYYDFEFLIDYLDSCTDYNPRFNHIKSVLEKCTSDISSLTESTLLEVSSVTAGLINGMAERSVQNNLRISAIGHSHLDLAWLWPLRETKRKFRRTLSTVLELLERYPDYLFTISQPQLMAWLKKDDPDLFHRASLKIADGRIEVQGAMWVEPDTNIPSGESLVRQILYGKKFWKEEFGIVVKNLWLPDAFGFSGTLPQILKKTGVDYFTTMKLSWNRVNQFPYHSFHWKGIDGSTVLTHMLPEGTYNSPANPGSVCKIHKKYHEKEISNHALMVFGIGDGGGGPGAEHLERLKRLKFRTTPVIVKQESISEFYSRLAPESAIFPTWEGELYLEKHQGTYTTQGLNKWYNRKIELSLRKMEISAVISMIISGKKYPDKLIEKIWKEVLLYQFHDILPGTSIKRVYAESLKHYETQSELIDTYIHEAEQFFAEKTEMKYSEGFSLIAFNYLSWEVSDWIEINRKWFRITVPSLGYSIFSDIRYSPAGDEFDWNFSTMGNAKLLIKFDRDGSILNIFDKENCREILSAGQKGNRISVYSDMGDAWDFPPNYRVNTPDRFILVGSHISVDGPKLINHQLYEYKKSTLVQDIVLTAGSRRIDFITRIIWQTPEKMVRVSFPVNIPDGKAICEIAFGAIERPIDDSTSWNLAKDEVSAHSWIDISNDDYGTALLNDSKYGHRVKDRILDLCLIRSVPYPGPVKGFTDLGEHNFTYSLFPHTGNYANGGVVQAAHELNTPISLIKIKKIGNNASQSFFSTGNPSLIISAIKKAENTDDIIIRLYESAGKGGTTWLSTDILWGRIQTDIIKVEASLVNLLEVFQKRLKIKKHRIKISFNPYEIISIRLTLTRKKPA